MSAGLRRGLTDLACRVLQATLPSSMQSWGWAVRCEAASIPDDTKALLFTLDSIRGLMPRALASHLLRPFASLSGDGAPFAKGSIAMNIFNATMRRPRIVGTACAIGAVLLGLAFMAVTGAPTRYLVINVGALAIGLAMLAALDHSAVASRRWTGGAILAMGGALLATALVGSQVDGAARWVNIGGLAIQPSLVLLPMMLVAFSRVHSVPATIGIITAAAGLALQPDRAMAGMLALSLATLAAMSRDRHVIVALAAGVVGFAATLARADTLPAAPYVDQILYSSFDVHAAAGLAVLGGSALLLVPAVIGWMRDADNRPTYAAFGAVWLAAIAAAALGNYPTPLVGYGGSAIIGYALSLLPVTRRTSIHGGVASRSGSKTDGALPDRHMLVGWA